MITRALLQAIQATAEICGEALSDGALEVLALDLAAHDEQAVFKSLIRCRREVRGRLALKDVLDRLDDGHPGAEEAWAMLPRNEGVTVVLTQQIAAALSVARPLIEDGDMVAARMAFKEVYNREIATAREDRSAPQWFASLGHDVGGREAPLREAAAKGRLTHEYVSLLLPPPQSNVLVLASSGTRSISEAARRALDHAAEAAP